MRELRNILYVAATHSPTDCIGVSVIDDVISQIARNQLPVKPPESEAAFSPPAVPSRSSPGSPQIPGSGNGAGTFGDIKARYIQELLSRYPGNRRRVAAELGVCERTLYRKLRKYNLT